MTLLSRGEAAILEPPCHRVPVIRSYQCQTDTVSAAPTFGDSAVHTVQTSPDHFNVLIFELFSRIVSG